MRGNRWYGAMDVGFPHIVMLKFLHLGSVQIDLSLRLEVKDVYQVSKIR